MSKQAENAVRTLLVVDDDEMLVAYLAEILQFAGYDVLTSTSGEEGLTLALEKEPALVLLDINMPGMSGLEVARNLRNESAIPFMFLSSLSDMEVVKQGTKYGGVGYLVKPVNHVQILPAVASALARADDIRQLKTNEASLTAALDSGRETSMAVGILMIQHNLTRQQAFQRLRDQSRTKRCKLSDIANELLKAHEDAIAHAKVPA